MIDEKVTGIFKRLQKESVLAPLFKLLEASFELFVPLVMAKIIDVGIGTGDNSYVLKMCGVLILLAFIGLTCAITAQYFAAKAAVGLRQNCVMHCLNIFKSCLLTNSTG